MDYEALDKGADELLEKHNAAYRAEREEVQNLVEQDELPQEQDEKPQDTQPRQNDDSAEKLRLADERVKNAQAKMTQAAQEAAELRREVAALREALQKAPKEPEPDTDAVEAAYPEIAAPLVAKIKKLEAKIAELSGNVQKTDQRVRESEEVAAGNQHLSAILKEHPDALEVIEQPSFESWKLKQPKAIQSIVETGSATDVNWMLSQYKSSLPKKKPDADPDDLSMPSLPKARKASADGGKPRFTREQIKRMSPEEFTKNEALIDEAMASGLIM